MLSLGQAQAAELQWSTEPYSHYSDQEPLRDVLKSLVATQGIPVVISGRIQDVVNVRFEPLPPGEIFTRLVNAYKLTWYYDGQALYVYPMDEVHTATLQLKHASVKEFNDSLERLDVLDSRFHWRVSEPDRLIYFAGPERFVSLVMEMAKVFDDEDGPAAGLVYKWTNEAGIVNYSTAPPPEISAAVGTVEAIRLQNGPVTTDKLTIGQLPPLTRHGSAPLIGPALAQALKRRSGGL
jgi:type II secretory pathway component GspD/PulD (secretin)